MSKSRQEIIDILNSGDVNKINTITPEHIDLLQGPGSTKALKAAAETIKLHTKGRLHNKIPKHLIDAIVANGIEDPRSNIMHILNSGDGDKIIKIPSDHIDLLEGPGSTEALNAAAETLKGRSDIPKYLIDVIVANEIDDPSPSSTPPSDPSPSSTPPSGGGGKKSRKKRRKGTGRKGTGRKGGGSKGAKYGGTKRKRSSKRSTKRRRSRRTKKH